MTLVKALSAALYAARTSIANRLPELFLSGITADTALRLGRRLGTSAHLDEPADTIRPDVAEKKARQAIGDRSSRRVRARQIELH